MGPRGRSEHLREAATDPRVSISTLGFVIVIPGLGGLALLYAGGSVAVGAFRSRRPESLSCRT